MGSRLVVLFLLPFCSLATLEQKAASGGRSFIQQTARASGGEDESLADIFEELDDSKEKLADRDSRERSEVKIGRSHSSSKSASLTEYHDSLHRSKQVPTMNIAFKAMGHGECVMEDGQVPQKEAQPDQGYQCESLCMANLQCKGYAVGGSDCVIYFSGPLIAMSAARTSSLGYDRSVDCYGKLLNSDGEVSSIGVGEAPQRDFNVVTGARSTPQVQPQPVMEPIDPELQRLNELRQQGDNSKHALRDLAKTLSNAGQDEAQMTEGVKRMGEGLGKTKEDVQQVGNSVRSLQAQLQKAEQATSSCLELQSSTRSQLDILKQEEQELRDEVERLRDALAKAEKGKAELDEQAAALKSKLKEVTDELEKKSRRRQKLQNDLNAATNDARAAQADVDRSRQELENTQALAEQNLAALQARVEAAQEAKDREEKNAAGAESAAAQLKDDLQNDRKDLREVQSELASSQADNHRLGTEAVSLRKEAAAKKDAAAREKNRLTAELKALKEKKEATAARASVLESKIEALKEQATQLQDAKDELLSHIKAAGQAADALEPLS